jgi:hypothetical protein
LASYKRALEVARGVHDGAIPDPTGGAMFFHSGEREELPEKHAKFFARLKSTGKDIPPFYFYK